MPADPLHVRRLPSLLRRPGVIAVAAVLLVAFVGAAGAAIGANTIGTAQVRDGSLTGLDVRNGALYGADLHPDTLTAREINERKLNVPANLDLNLPAVVVANAAAGASVAESYLLSSGPIIVTATCWKQADTGVLHSDVFAKSTVNGALLESPLDNKLGGTAAAGFLNVDTAKTDRMITSPEVAANTWRLAGSGATEFSVWAPGGSFERGSIHAILQNGSVTGVTPPLGAGDRCGYFGFISAVAA